MHRDNKGSNENANQSVNHHCETRRHYGGKLAPGPYSRWERAVDAQWLYTTVGVDNLMERKISLCLQGIEIRSVGLVAMPKELLCRMPVV
jgi:hypothetical protein